MFELILICKIVFTFEVVFIFEVIFIFLVILVIEVVFIFEVIFITYKMKITQNKNLKIKDDINRLRTNSKKVPSNVLKSLFIQMLYMAILIHFLTIPGWLGSGRVSSLKKLL